MNFLPSKSRPFVSDLVFAFVDLKWANINASFLIQILKSHKGSNFTFSAHLELGTQLEEIQYFFCVILVT